MKFFVDSAETEEIKRLVDTGLVDGITTNPSLVAKSGRPYVALLEEITRLVSGPVSAEVLSEDCHSMLQEGRSLAAIAENVVVKLPLTTDGIKACSTLIKEGIRINITLCFSAVQALLAAKAGATFVSPFVGRLDDLSQGGMQLIRDIVSIYKNYDNISTQVLVASVRSPLHVAEAAKMGADIVTLPPKILWQLFNHPLTDKGLTAFIADYKARDMVD
ncbi:transaldolase [Rickettsiales bacterium]|nr:transaldolase [Rickettsiales bacterium]